MPARFEDIYSLICVELFRKSLNRLFNSTRCVSMIFCAFSRSSSSKEKSLHDRIRQGILQEQQMELSAAEQKERISAFAVQPKLSILMPIYNAPVKWLEIAILSVQSQSYTNWELCMVDDGSEDTRGLSLIDKAYAKNIKHVPHDGYVLSLRMPAESSHNPAKNHIHFEIRQVFEQVRFDT